MRAFYCHRRGRRLLPTRLRTRLLYLYDNGGGDKDDDTCPRASMPPL